VRAAVVTDRLVDGSQPAVPADLFARLDALGVPYRTHHHDPVFTVEQAKRLRGDLPGCHTKNLFVRNKKGRMWLLVFEQDCPVDLAAVGGRIGAGRLSFGSPRRLMEYLGITPGAVSPFAVINDRTRAVRVVLDREVLENPPLNFHPLDNTMTTVLAPADFLRFLEAEEHGPRVLGLE
jgi:Ala-tRNA(Pro) deacylase